MKKYTIKLTDSELGRIIFALNQQDRRDIDYLIEIRDPHDCDVYSEILDENLELTSKLIALRG